MNPLAAALMGQQRPPGRPPYPPFNRPVARPPMNGQSFRPTSIPKGRSKRLPVPYPMPQGPYRY